MIAELALISSYRLLAAVQNRQVQKSALLREMQETFLFLYSYLFGFDQLLLMPFWFNWS